MAYQSRLITLLVACCLLILTPAVAGYQCLDYYKHIGKVLREVTFPKQQQQQLTSGDFARICNSHCDAESECSAAWSVASVTTHGADCKLLSHTAADVAAALKPAAGVDYPILQPEFKARNGSKEKSLSWLCLKRHEDWDDFGAITNKVIMQGQPADESWCAYATDAAGNNIDDWQGSSNLAQCAARCSNTTQCSFWIGRPGHCWLKYSPLVGSDGWTAAYRPDWLSQHVEPNAAATCFKNIKDWQELGEQLSPNIKTMQYKGRWYTLFPERVNFTEAAAACARLPDGSLAMLDDRAALTAVGNDLLPTLPMMYSVQVAWVGVVGVVDNATAAIISGDMQQSAPAAAGGAAVNAASDQGSVAVSSTGQQQQQQQGPYWLGSTSNRSVDKRFYTHPSERYLQWRGSDRSFSQYAPQAGKRVCGAVLGVPPPSAASSFGQRQEGHTQPGLYLFTCARPTAFICQSSSVPRELLQQSGRITPNATTPWASMATNSTTSSTISSQQLVLAIVLPVAAVLLMLTWLCCLCSRHLRWLVRFISTQRKRALGLPSKGSLSVVVTDIQGFTALMETHPEEMGQALLQHNEVIREAAYANAGRVLEQEGDAFILGFCEPLDAALFALQIQLALMRMDVAPEIHYEDDWECQRTCSSHKAGVTSPPHHSANAGRRPSLSTIDDATFTAEMSTAANSEASAAAAAGPFTGLAQPSSGSSTLRSWQPGPPPAAAAALGSNSSRSSKLDNRCLCSPLRLLSKTDSACSAREQHLSENLSPRATQRSKSRLSRRLSSAGSWWRQLVQPQRGLAAAVLFRGLRVRVGIATGQLQKGQAVETSMAYSMARVISECANGGQVLMDQATFMDLRGELHLLGAVTADGLDFGKMRTDSSTAPAWKLCRLGRASQAPKPPRPSPQAAVVLDMGLYETPLHALPSVATLTDVADIEQPSSVSLPKLSFQHSNSQRQQQQQQQQPPLHEQQPWLQHSVPNEASVFEGQATQPGFISKALSRVSRAATHHVRGISSGAEVTPHRGDAASSSSSSRPAAGAVRLYQLLCPDLAGRAVLFGNRLALCESWRCLDPPYFAAPGLCGVSEGDPRQVESTLNSNAGTPARHLSAPESPPAQDPQQQQQFDHTPPGTYCIAGTAADAVGPPDSSQKAADAKSSAEPFGKGGNHVVRSTSSSRVSRGSGSSSVAALRAMSLHCSWADLSTQGPSPRVSLHFPPVTVVFMAVEGAEHLQQQQREQQCPSMRQLHALLQRLILESLCQLPGYLVKAQEAELKYMMTFSSCSTAVQWCLMVQQAALHLPYPDALLQHRSFRRVHNAGGQLVFRGPRLKMGVHEGTPRCIIPDHVGRADYLGPGVNQAARFADAAAHGGQVAVELGLAKRILQAWRHEGNQQQASHYPGPTPAATAAAQDTADTTLGSLMQQVSTPQHQQQQLQHPAAAVSAVRVDVLHLGCFLFKGCAKSMNMVSFSLASLSGRSYPAEPPRGKGVRLAHQSGRLDSLQVPLPASVGDITLFDSH